MLCYQLTTEYLYHDSILAQVLDFRQITKLCIIYRNKKIIYRTQNVEFAGNNLLDKLDKRELERKCKYGLIVEVNLRRLNL